MIITVIVTGDLCNGYEAVRPIVLEAEMVMEARDDLWLVSDNHFRRYGVHAEFRLALAECLEGMVAYFELCQKNARSGSANKTVVEEMLHYLKRGEKYDVYRGTNAAGNDDESGDAMSDDLREQLADVSHDIWSSWMRWMFTVGTFNADGTWTMPADKVERWLWQMNVPYALLTEGEKDSDREQAEKILAVIEPSVPPPDRRPNFAYPEET